MQSPNRTYLPLLDIIRFFSAIWVLLYHSIQVIPSRNSVEQYSNTDNPLVAIVSQGWMAVSIFICVSGFSLARGLDGQSVFWRGYFIARFLRVAPLYYLVLFLHIGLSSNVIEPATFFENLLIIPTPNPIQPSLESPFLWTVWSVKVEFLIYFFLPILAYLASKHSFKRFALYLGSFLCGLVLIALLVSKNSWIVIYWSFVGRLVEFSIGFFIGFYNMKLKTNALRFLALAASLLLMTGIAISVNRLGSISQLTVGPRSLFFISLLAAIVLILVWSNHSIDKLAYGPLLRAILQSSYSIYIWHMTIVGLFGLSINALLWSALGNKALSLALSVLSVCVLTLIWSLISYLVIEQPLLALRPKYLRKT